MRFRSRSTLTCGIVPRTPVSGREEEGMGMEGKGSSLVEVPTNPKVAYAHEQLGLDEL